MENDRLLIAPQFETITASEERKLRVDYRWKPIEPISGGDRSLDLSDIKPLGESWKQFRGRLRETNEAGLRRFNERLVRSLSIETGILERLYDLDRGTTLALILKGFHEDLIQRESTNIEPSTLVQILRDQEAAVYMVQELVSSRRPLTRGALLELHATLTRHQETVAVVDQFGKRFEIPLRRGAFKEHPNNPQRPDGSMHEYCPPEHVGSEVDNLLTWYGSCENEDPILVSAWLHHRFTQIHPFQDGNGRVARVLTTMVLLKAGLLPLVIDRDRRLEYVEALERADTQSLDRLVGLFSALEKNAILQALSLDVEGERQVDRTLTEAVIESLATKFRKRREAKRQEFLAVNRISQQLRGEAKRMIDCKLQELARDAFSWAERPDVFVAEGGPDFQNSHWYKFEVTSLNEASNKWINFDEGHYFIKAAFRYEKVRLVFVASFHHIGKELTGVMEATAFALIETYDEAVDEGDEQRERMGRKVIPASVQPFVITWNSSSAVLLPAFSRWLDQCLAISLKEWGDRV